MRLVAAPARFVRRFAAGLVLAALSGMQMAVAAPATASASGVNADRDRDGDGVVDSLDAFPFDPTRTLPIDGVSATVDRQILVALTPEDTAAANPFDLHGRTLVFTPDGNGGYSRDVRALAWEEDLGPAVADGAVIELGGFGFAFAGRRWDAFHVSRHGLLTFGGPLAYRYWDAENRFDTMTEIAGKLIDVPTISPLYKPMLGGAHRPLRGRAARGAPAGPGGGHLDHDRARLLRAGRPAGAANPLPGGAGRRRKHPVQLRRRPSGRRHRRPVRG